MLTFKNVLFILIASGLSTVAHADCPAGRASTSLLCSSYDFNLPVTVAGTIESTTGGFVFPDGTTQLTAATGTGGSSPWTTSGNNVYYTNGHVGIGTSTPGYNGAYTNNILTVNGGTGRGMMELATSAPDGAGNVVGQFGFFATSNTGSNGMQTAAIFSMTTGTAVHDRGGNLRFYTKPDGGAIAERFHIDSLGNVGVGTSTPGLNGLANTLTVHSPASRGMLELSTAQADAAGKVTGQVGFFSTALTGSHGKQTGAILSITEGTTTADRGGTLNFYTKPDGGDMAERLHIASAGNIGVGTASPSYKLDVSGTIRGYGITDASDVRLKKDITPLTDELEKVQALQGVSYNWKDSARDSARQIGLIAQDVEKIYPELVKTDKDGMKSVNYSHLVAPLVEAVKELSAQNAELRARLDQVEKELRRK